MLKFLVRVPSMCKEYIAQIWWYGCVSFPRLLCNALKPYHIKSYFLYAFLYNYKFFNWSLKLTHLKWINFIPKFLMSFYNKLLNRLGFFTEQLLKMFLQS